MNLPKSRFFPDYSQHSAVPPCLPLEFEARKGTSADLLMNNDLAVFLRLNYMKAQRYPARGVRKDPPLPGSIAALL